MRVWPHRRPAPAPAWLGAFAVAALLIARFSTAGAITGLAAFVLLFRIPWWQPLLLALGLLLAAPLAAAIGAASSLDDFAVVALALAGIAVGMLCIDARRRA